jgi:hypothetical protein
MKTFGLFMIIWAASIIATTIAFKDVKEKEMITFIMATHFAYIMYRLYKEESKN